MSYTVLLTVEAQDDLGRLFDFVLDRELARPDGNLDLAAQQQACPAIRVSHGMPPARRCRS